MTLDEFNRWKYIEKLINQITSGVVVDPPIVVDPAVPPVPPVPPIPPPEPPTPQPGVRSGLSVRFAMRCTDKPQGLIHSVPGCRVIANFQEGTLGRIHFHFQQGHFRKFLGDPTVFVDVPELNEWHTYEGWYDLRTARTFLDNLQVMERWLGNSVTELIA